MMRVSPTVIDAAAPGGNVHRIVPEQLRHICHDVVNESICALYVSRLRFAVLPPTAGGVANYSLFEGYAHLGSGLACGLSALAAGLAIGIGGDAGTRAIGQIRDTANRNQMFTGVVLVLIFGEALSLFGLIVSLVLSQKSAPGACT